MFTFAQLIALLAAVVLVAGCSFAAGYNVARYKYQVTHEQGDAVGDYVKSMIEQIPDLADLVTDKAKASPTEEYDPKGKRINPIWQ